MKTVATERAIVKSNINPLLFRPPAIVNLPLAISEKIQETIGKVENLPAIAKGILQINLPDPPPRVSRSVVHQRKEEVFD